MQQHRASTIAMKFSFLIDCESEFYFRCFFRAFYCFEIRMFLETEKSCYDVFRETADCCVVPLGCFVEFSAFHTDSVFRTFKLSLQSLEVFIGFKVGIVFCNGKQSAESCTYLALCLLVCLKFLRSKFVNADCCLSSFRPCRNNGIESFLFVCRISLYSVYEVRDKVGATLVLVLYVAPCCTYRFVLCYKRVVG